MRRNALVLAAALGAAVLMVAVASAELSEK